MDSSLNYLINNINNTPILNEPYDYLYIENFIDKNLYNSVVKSCNNIMNKKQYDILSHTSSIAPATKYEKFTEWANMGNRYRYEFMKNNKLKKNLDISINNYLELLLNQNVQNAILNKFKYKRANKNTSFYSTLDYVTEKFEYPVHNDVKPKNISLIHYLAPDNNSQHLGTMLYNEKRKYVKTPPYKKNSCFIFAPYDNPATNHRMKYENLGNNPYRISIATNYLY